MKKSKLHVFFVVSAVVCCFASIALLVIENVLKSGDGFDNTSKLLFEGFAELLLAVTALCIIPLSGVRNFVRFKICDIFGVLAVLAGLAVALANFPLATIISGEFVVGDLAVLPSYLLYCFAVGLFEETTFRGLFFPAVLTRVEHDKRGLVIAIVASSAVFSLVHILNIFAGASASATLLQLGYTFLVGCMCAIILVETQSLFFPVLVHFVYDVGGLATAGGLGVGSQWNAVGATVMAVASVGAGVYYIARLWHSKTICRKLWEN